MKVEWVQYKGKKVLLTNYVGVKTQEDMFQVLRDSAKMVEGIKGGVLSVIDVTGAPLGPDFMKESKERGAEFAKIVDKSAIVGVTGLKKMLLKGYRIVANSKVVPFDTREEALDYVVS